MVAVFGVGGGPVGDDPADSSVPPVAVVRTAGVSCRMTAEDALRFTIGRLCTRELHEICVVIRAGGLDQRSDVLIAA